MPGSPVPQADKGTRKQIIHGVGYESTNLPAGNLTNALWVFLYILFATAPRMPGADEFGVIFETGRNGFATVSVALHKFNHLSFFLMLPPFLEGNEVGKYESVSIVTIATAIR